MLCSRIFCCLICCLAKTNVLRQASMQLRGSCCRSNASMQSQRRRERGCNSLVRSHPFAQSLTDATMRRKHRRQAARSSLKATMRERSIASHQKKKVFFSFLLRLPSIDATASLSYPVAGGDAFPTATHRPREETLRNRGQSTPAGMLRKHRSIASTTKTASMLRSGCPVDRCKRGRDKKKKLFFFLFDAEATRDASSILDAVKALQSPRDA